MSDDEREIEGEDEISPQQEEQVESAPKPKAEPKQRARVPSIDHEDGKPEAELRMEMEKKKRREKVEEEWKEYEELRKSERETENEEIRQLREKKERRKIERAEQEKKLAEQRALDTEKRKAEEEERQKRKKDEELKKKAEREKKLLENEERNKKMGIKNFVVSKKAGNGAVAEEKEQKPKEPQKSKEQLESEKRAVLEQRIVPLKIDGFNQQQLTDKAKELYQQIYHLEAEKYDLEQRFKRQQVDLAELAERARQLAKGGGKKGNQQTVSESCDTKGGMVLQPKVVMYSQYERLKDHRSFGERKDVFTGPLYQDEYTRIPPTKKITMTEQGAKIEGELEENHAEATA